MQEPYDFNEIRYYFEHVELPDWFYRKGEKMIKKLGEEGGTFLQRVMELLCKEVRQEMCNIKGQYKVIVCEKCEEYSMIRIDMPEPEREMLCSRVYLVYSGDYRRRKYFTVERGVSPEVKFLCSWEPDGNHCNYGQHNMNMSETEKRIVEIFGNSKSSRFPGRSVNC